jgi:hypothetical protein
LREIETGRRRTYGRFVFVRITLDIPDKRYRQLKSKAAKEGVTVEEIILRSVGIEPELLRKRRPQFVSLPLIRSKHPGSVVLDNAKIFEIDPFP